MTDEVQEKIAEAAAEVEPPINVTPTALPDQLFALMRQLTLVVGGFVTLLALLRTRDIAGVIEFLRSSDFVSAVIGLVTLLTLIYGNVRVRLEKKRLIVSAAAAPDSVARVVAKK